MCRHQHRGEIESTVKFGSLSAVVTDSCIARLSVCGFANMDLYLSRSYLVEAASDGEGRQWEMIILSLTASGPVDLIMGYYSMNLLEMQCCSACELLGLLRYRVILQVGGRRRTASTAWLCEPTTRWVRSTGRRTTRWQAMAWIPTCHRCSRTCEASTSTTTRYRHWSVTDMTLLPILSSSSTSSSMRCRKCNLMTV